MRLIHITLLDTCALQVITMPLKTSKQPSQEDSDRRSPPEQERTREGRPRLQASLQTNLMRERHRCLLHLQQRHLTSEYLHQGQTGMNRHMRTSPLPTVKPIANPIQNMLPV